MESEVWHRFREAFVAGQWDTAEVALADLGIKYDDDLRSIKFLIRRQKYLELLEAAEVEKAMSVLRNELMPLGATQPTVKPPTPILEASGRSKSAVHASPALELNKLASCIIFARSGSVGHDTMRQHVQWFGTGLDSRKHELNKMASLMPSSLSIVPEGRLTTLVHQALAEQERRCFDRELGEAYRDAKESAMQRSEALLASTKPPPSSQPLHRHHSSVRHGGPINLFEDHHCIRNWRTWALEASAKDSQGELHVIAFSPCGAKIASGGANGVIYVHAIVHEANSASNPASNSDMTSGAHSGVVGDSSSPQPPSSEHRLVLEHTLLLPPEIPVHASKTCIVSLDWANLESDSTSFSDDAAHMSVDEVNGSHIDSDGTASAKNPRYWLLVCYQGGAAIFDVSRSKCIAWVSPHTPKAANHAHKLSAGSIVILEEGAPKNGSTTTTTSATQNPEREGITPGSADNLTAAHWIPPQSSTTQALFTRQSTSAAKGPKYFAFGGLDGKLRLVSVDKALRYYTHVIRPGPQHPHARNGFTNGFTSQHGHDSHANGHSHGAEEAPSLAEEDVPMQLHALDHDEENPPLRTIDESSDLKSSMDVDETDGKQGASEAAAKDIPSTSSNGFHPTSATQDTHSLSPILKIWRFPPINDFVVTRRGLAVTIDQAKHICFTDVQSWLSQHNVKHHSAHQNGRDHRAAEGGVGRGSGHSSRLSTAPIAHSKQPPSLAPSHGAPPPSTPIKAQLNLTSCSLSPDHQFLLVTTMSIGAPFKGLHHQQSILIYNLNNFSLHETIHGQKQARFVVRAALGGSAAAQRSARPSTWMSSDSSDSTDATDSSMEGVPSWLLASGSEDSLIHLWELPSSFASQRSPPHVDPTNKLAPMTLPSSHSSVVNDVAWHPTNPCMLASVSDDHSLRLWLYKWSH